MDRENGQVKFYQPEITMKSHGFFLEKKLPGSFDWKFNPENYAGDPYKERIIFLSHHFSGAGC